MRPAPPGPPPAAREPYPGSTSVVTGAVQRPFHWSQVESADYLVYIENLRRVGCPEQTIRDIIVADVNQLYAPRYAALRTSAPELAWWGRFDSRHAVRPGLSEQLRLLNEEKKSLLVRLLGPTAGAEPTGLEASIESVRTEGALSFLAAGKREVVRDLLKRHDELLEWSRAQWKGLPSDEVDAREADWRAARFRELSGLLTPEELREFDVRYSPVADELRERFGRADLTEAEFRKLHELSSVFDQEYPNADRDDLKRLDEELRSALGPDRFADVARQNDSAWRALQSLAGEHQISPTAVQQAYALHESFRDKLVAAVGQMFADPQQNPQPLRDLAAERDRQLEAILGAGVVQQLNHRNALPRLVVQDDGQKRTYSFSPGTLSE